MLTFRQFVARSKNNKRLLFSRTARNSSTSPLHSVCRTDKEEDGGGDAIPSEPTWSVHGLLASYPRPRLSHDELTKLHSLSALAPPEEGSEAATRMRSELEEMIRLVEAVKLVDTSELEGTEDGAIPDGRIWEEGKGMLLSSNTREVEFEDAEVESGRTLLSHAKGARDGFYFVEVDRRKE